MLGAAPGTFATGSCTWTRGMVGRPSMLRCLPCLMTVGMVGHILSSAAHRAAEVVDSIDGLWPMMRRVAVTGATRALRCRDWHEVRGYFFS